MTAEAEWEAQRAERERLRNAGGGCIGCPHGFHLHTCPFNDCLCDNQGRTETMQDRRAKWDKQRAAEATYRLERIAQVRADIAKVFWGHVSVMPLNALMPGSNFGPVLDDMAIAAVDGLPAAGLGG